MNSYKSNEKNQSNLRLDEHHFTHLVFNFISSIKGGQQLFLSDEKLDVKVLVEKSTNKIIVELSFNTTAKEGDEKIFNLSAGYKGVFVYTPLTEPQLITSFAKINAPAIIYPFLRASIASITLAVGVPPMALPVINFTKFPVEIIEETSN
jgi:preprotein translocase subunit SecB